MSRKIRNHTGWRPVIASITAVLLLFSLVYAEEQPRKFGTTGIYTVTGVTDSMSVAKYIDGFSVQFTTSDAESLWFEIEGCYDYNALTGNFPFKNMDADNDTLFYNDLATDSTGVAYFPYRIGYTRINILKLAGGAAKQVYFMIMEN